MPRLLLDVRFPHAARTHAPRTRTPHAAPSHTFVATTPCHGLLHANTPSRFFTATIRRPEPALRVCRTNPTPHPINTRCVRDALQLPFTRLHNVARSLLPVRATRGDLPYTAAPLPPVATRYTTRLQRADASAFTHTPDRCWFVHWDLTTYLLYRLLAGHLYFCATLASVSFLGYSALYLCVTVGLITAAARSITLLRFCPGLFDTVRPHARSCHVFLHRAHALPAPAAGSTTTHLFVVYQRDSPTYRTR